MHRDTRKTAYFGYILYIALVCLFGDVDGAFTVQPKDTATRNGSSVTFECSVDNTDGIDWHQRPSTGSFRIVNNCVVENAYIGIYDVDNSPATKCNLIVLKADVSAVYYCQEENSGSTTADVSLTITSELTCSQSSIVGVAGDEITYTCQVSYDGLSVPELRWLNNLPNVNTTGSGIVNSVGTYTIPNGLTTVPTFTCSVDVPSVNGFNSYSWTSSSFTVSYGVRSGSVNINGVSDGDSDVEISRILTCTAADAYPAASFSWTDVSNGGATSSGTTFTVTREGEYEIFCTASNTVIHADGSQVDFSENSPTIKFNATASTFSSTTIITTSSLSSSSCTCEDNNNELPAVISLGVLFGVTFICLIVSIVYNVYQHRRQVLSKSQSSTSSTNFNPIYVNVTSHDANTESSSSSSPPSSSAAAASQYAELQDVTRQSSSMPQYQTLNNVQQSSNNAVQ